MTTPTNESNAAYDRRQLAGKLLIEAPKGAVFQYENDAASELPNWFFEFVDDKKSVPK